MSTAVDSVRPGSVIAGRFELLREAGAGGMGAVYRARDLQTGLPVAVKVLLEKGETERFAEEARVLAGVHHPAVVRYVARGTTADGAPYLVMEWLDGEDLVDRLSRGRLAIGETVTLAKAVAEALVEVHASGAVHRDLKPSNLFLCGGRVEGVKILDFGIALPRDRARHLTRTGTTIGTPGYMAPEQARGAPGIGPGADLFSLGCVLFECLTGQPAFTGDHVIALLAKVLLEEVPRVTVLRPEVPVALADLVERMMSKLPEARPGSATDVLTALAELGAVDRLDAMSRGAATSKAPAPVHLTTGEQRLVSVILVGVGQAAPASTAPPTGMSETVSVEALGATTDSLSGVARAHGAALDHLAEGTWVLTLSGAGEATDLAALSARCALEVRAVGPASPVVLAMGRGVRGQRAPSGEVIERAARLLQESSGKGPSPGIRVDELTAGLAGDRFDIRSDGGRLLLRGEREAGGAGARMFLGRAMPCVGRDRELRALLDEIDASIADRSARALLVTGEAGVGKSRLRHELLRRLGTWKEPPEIWMARGDPLSAGAPFGLLGQALRGAAGVRGGEPLEERRRKLRARIGRHLGDEAQRVTEFLGELCGAPFPDKGNVQLRAARRDLVVMGDQMRGAWIDFIDAECQAQPVVLVLEDLHWGDLPTIQQVDAALRLCAERPFVVLALARSNVDTMYPGLWSKRSLVTIHLGGLSRRACSDIARDVLGEAARPETLERLWAQSAGNPFFLEELLRAVVEGRDGDAPLTVLAMVQARLERLDGEARRVLRAASVFGQRFWRGGVSELLGGASVDGALGALAEAELVTRARDTKLEGEIEHAFRHSLVREAAYGMLTEEDRATGHRLAGAWLERSGEGAASVLAEHAERGGEPGRAAVWYRKAAEHAFEGNDLALAHSWGDRAMTCAAGEPLLGDVWIGEVHLLMARASLWRGQNREGMRCALEAVHRLSRGGASWYRAVAELALASGRVHEPEQLQACFTALLGPDLEEEPAIAEASGVTASRAVALAHTARIGFLVLGIVPAADALLQKSEVLADRLPDDPAAGAEVRQSRFIRALIKGDLSGGLAHARTARAMWLQIGDLRNACAQDANMGYIYLQLGEAAAAEPVLRSALKEAERLGLSALRATAKSNLAVALAHLGRLAEASAMVDEAVLSAREDDDRRTESFGKIYLARIALLAGDRERASQESSSVFEHPAPLGVQAFALAVCSTAHLAQGRPSEALETAGRAMELLTSIGEVEEGEALIRLAYVEAHHRAGDPAKARAAAEGARARLLARAAKIADPDLRRSFLTRVPENARTLDLARELLGEPADAGIEGS